MIQEVLDVENLTVRDAMVPRVDLPLLPLKSKRREAPYRTGAR
jgi:CBS domain containing-hemolysin-like protein